MLSRYRSGLLVAGMIAALQAAGPAGAGPYEQNARAGQQAVAKGDLRAAERAFRAAAEANPKRSLPHKYLADIAFRQQRLQDAAAEARRSLLLEPNDGDTHYNLGMYLLYAANMQPTDEVVAELKRAVELNGRDAEAASNLGAALFLLKRYEEAVAPLQRATKITPFWAPYWSNLGEALLATGRLDEAVTAFATAAEPRRLGLLSGDAYRNTLGDIYLNWGKAELKRGLTANAQSYLKRVVEGLSDHAPSRARVDEARTLLADSERRLKAEQEALARREQERQEKLQAEARRREEEAKRREEALRQQQEELRRQQEELARRQEEERKRLQQEAERKRREEELRVQQEALRRQEEELKRKQQEEAARRRQQEEEARRREQDTTPPVLTLRDAGEGVQSRDLVLVGMEEEQKPQAQVISGTASDNVAVVEVTVAGKPATLYQSRDLVVTEELGVSADFSAEVAIQPGENRIEIVAADRAGNKARKLLIINGKKQDAVEAMRTATQEVAAAASQRFALLIGVDQYDSPELAPLRSSVADARALHALLTDPKCGGFSPQNVVLLTDDQADAARRPNRNSIYDGLAWLQRNAKPDDLVILSYSGHGFRARETGAAYLLPADARLNLLERTAIANSELIRLLSQIPARRKVVILDACHGGGVGQGAKLSREYYDPFVQAEGTVTLASCSGDEQSFEYPGRVQGAFAHFLCDGLSGKGDADGNGVVTFREASDYVARSVAEWARGQGLMQTPLSSAGSARLDIALSTVREVELEQRKQKLLATFDDRRVRSLSLSLMEKESTALSDKESLALMVLEQVLRGESRKELYLDLLQRLHLL